MSNSYHMVTATVTMWSAHHSPRDSELLDGDYIVHMALSIYYM